MHICGIYIFVLIVNFVMEATPVYLSVLATNPVSVLALARKTLL